VKTVADLHGGFEVVGQAEAAQAFLATQDGQRLLPEPPRKSSSSISRGAVPQWRVLQAGRGGEIAQRLCSVSFSKDVRSPPEAAWVSGVGRHWTN